jgi:diguanylate cyclase (GGDEF)-like protein
MLAVREKRAEFDPLMADYEILSRGAAEHTLEKMVEMGERLGFPVALARKDLDKFKELNDTYGHEAGDEGLRRFGKQISQDKRKSDEIARKGGDEFEGYYAGAVKAQMEKRLAESMQAFQRENIGTIFAGLSASIGIADTTEITPGLKDIDGKEISAVEQLKALAERRMLEAKRQGRNRIITEDPPKEHNV